MTRYALTRDIPSATPQGAYTRHPDRNAARCPAEDGGTTEGGEAIDARRKSGTKTVLARDQPRFQTLCGTRVVAPRCEDRNVEKEMLAWAVD